MNTINVYKRLYAEETKLDEPADMDDMDETEEEMSDNVDTIATHNIVIKSTVYVNSDVDAPIEKINSNLAKQGDFYLCSYDLIGNDIFDVDVNWTSIEELLLKYREKFNGKISDLAVKELKKLTSNSI